MKMILNSAPGFPTRHRVQHGDTASLRTGPLSARVCPEVYSQEQECESTTTPKIDPTLDAEAQSETDWRKWATDSARLWKFSGPKWCIGGHPVGRAPIESALLNQKDPGLLPVRDAPHGQQGAHNVR